MSKEQTQPQPDRFPEREVRDPVFPAQREIVFNGAQDTPNEADHLIRPAHTPGHFPTAEEVTRLENLEQHRAQQNREYQKRWRENHPEAHLQQVLKWQKSPEGKAYRNTWKRARRASQKRKEIY